MDTVFQPDTKSEEKKKVLELERMKKCLERQILEMTRTVEKQQELIALANQDPLTGLRNRQGISEQVNAMLRAGCKGTFFIMDMDNFKSVNDTYGHMEGDNVLVRFAKALGRAVEEDDIAARLGGDEFVIFSPGYRDKSAIRLKAQQIIRQMERGLVAPGRLARVTVSMGIARAPHDGLTYEALYANSDKALYFTKNDGKNGYRFYEDIKERDCQETGSARPYRSLSEITGRMRERKMEGSFEVAYSNFENIYRFMERCLIRENREVQCVLFSIDDMDADEPALQGQLERLQYAVTFSLRKGDVTAKYSPSQVLALLMDTNKQNADMVVHRILDRYRMEAGTDAMQISYDIQQLMAGKEIC